MLLTSDAELAQGCCSCPRSQLSPSNRPPDGGYGWICVISCFLVNCFTWGVVAVRYTKLLNRYGLLTLRLSQAYGIYLERYLSGSFFPEATPDDYAIIGGLNFSMAMVVAPAVNVASQKYSTKIAMLFGIVLLAVGYVSASFAERIWHLYLSQGVLVGFGVGFTYIPTISIIPQWFERKRSLVNGICAAGSGIGGLIFSFMSDAVISNISLRWSLRLTAILSCSILLAAASLIRDRNDIIRPTQLGLDLQLLGRWQVILLLMWSFLIIWGYMILLFSLPDYARSVGLSDHQAATLNAVLNLGTAVGRPLIGIASDHLGRIEVAGVITLASGLSCLMIWLPATSYAVLIVFSVVIGGMFGVFWVVSDLPRSSSPLTRRITAKSADHRSSAEIVSLTELPSLLSLSWLSTVLPATCEFTKTVLENFCVNWKKSFGARRAQAPPAGEYEAISISSMLFCNCIYFRKLLSIGAVDTPAKSRQGYHFARLPE